MFSVIVRGILCICLLLVEPIHAASLVVNDPRPVAKAMEQLEAIYGVPITYEDPLYVHETEILDVTAQVSRDPRTNPRVLVPRGGTFAFTYDVPVSVAAQSAVKAAAASKTIMDALYSYAALRTKEMFRVAQDNGSFHIVPTQFINASGRLEQMQPILDTSVSILPKQRNGADLVTEICQLLSVATHQTVVVGTVPLAQLTAHATKITASNEAARSVLSRLLAEMSLSWQLFYDPGLHWYVFNIHAVDTTK